MAKLLVFLILFTQLALADNKQDVNQVIDSLHIKASQADFEGYFSLYSDNAVFIGTDASETWSIEEFKAYTKPIFNEGRGWTYHTTERHVYIATDNNTAWFNELLQNKALGTTRGSGVLVKINNKWKIAQYHLTIPIPNELADDIAAQIKTFENKDNKRAR